MFLRKPIMKSTENISESIERLKKELETAEVIVIGAGAGLSSAAGFLYSGQRFDTWFWDFREKYGIRDMYSGGFYPYETLEDIGPGGPGIFMLIDIPMGQKMFTNAC